MEILDNRAFIVQEVSTMSVSSFSEDNQLETVKLSGYIANNTVADFNSVLVPHRKGGDSKHTKGKSHPILSIIPFIFVFQTTKKSRL